MGGKNETNWRGSCVWLAARTPNPLLVPEHTVKPNLVKTTRDLKLLLLGQPLAQATLSALDSISNFSAIHGPRRAHHLLPQSCSWHN